WRQRRHQLLLLAPRHPEPVERLAEILHQRAEVLAGDSHAAMRALHVATGVDARPAARLADLLNQLVFEARNVGLGTELVDPAIACDIAHEIINHRFDGGLAAETLIERLLRRRMSRGRVDADTEHGRERGDSNRSHGFPLSWCNDDRGSGDRDLA